MKLRNKSPVYRLEVYDDRDASVRQYNADEKATWTENGMYGEETPVFGKQTKRKKPYSVLIDPSNIARRFPLLERRTG